MKHKTRRCAVPLTVVLYGLGILLLVVILGSLAIRGFRQVPHDPEWPVPGGSAERGRVAVERYSCGSCHVIPGIRTAQGRVGPQLREFSRQAYIAGQLPNVPHHLVWWIQEAPRFAPGTAMPDLPVTDQDARDIAAYLYSVD